MVLQTIEQLYFISLQILPLKIWLINCIIDSSLIFKEMSISVLKALFNNFSL